MISFAWSKTIRLMELIIKEGNLTYIKKFGNAATPEDMLIGAYELISKVYSQEAVIRLIRTSWTSETTNFLQFRAARYHILIIFAALFKIIEQ